MTWQRDSAGYYHVSQLQLLSAYSEIQLPDSTCKIPGICDWQKWMLIRFFCQHWSDSENTYFYLALIWGLVRITI